LLVEPSVHTTVVALVLAALVAFASTPPCPAHAPRPVAVLFVPSVQMVCAPEAAIALSDSASVAIAVMKTCRRMVSSPQ
jgi:hypothetical protein